MALIMDSSPRPIRRFSRWKTTKRTFVLGGKTFTTGKEIQAGDQKNVQKNGDEGTRTRWSPRSPQRSPCQSSSKSPQHRKSFQSPSKSPHHRKLSSQANSKSKKVSPGGNRKTYNGTKAVIGHLQDPKSTTLESNREKVHHNKDVNSSAHALSVVCPNLTISIKDILQDTAHVQPCSIEESNRLSQSESVIPTSVGGAEEDSNADSVSTDKENSTSVITVQSNGLTSPGVNLAEASVGPNVNEGQSGVDESSPRDDSRRHSLRDRSRLASSAVLEHKNYPFFSTSDKKSRKRKVSSMALNGPTHTESTSKASAKKGARVSGKHPKQSEKREKSNKSAIDTNSASISPIKQDACLAKPDRRNGLKSTASLPENPSMKYSRRKEFIPKNHSQIDKEKNNSCRKLEDINFNKSGNSNIEIQSQVDCIPHSSLAQAQGDVRVGDQSSVELSSTVSCSHVPHDSTARRHLRDRSSLATPALQYPARYMSSAQLKSLSSKAKRLLSLTQNAPEASAHGKLPQKSRHNANSEKNNKKNANIGSCDKHSKEVRNPQASEKSNGKSKSTEIKSKKRTKTEGHSRTSRKENHLNKQSDQVAHISLISAMETGSLLNTETSLRQDQSDALCPTSSAASPPKHQLQKGLNHKITKKLSNHSKPCTSPTKSKRRISAVPKVPRDRKCEKVSVLKKSVRTKNAVLTDDDQGLAVTFNGPVEQMDDRLSFMEQDDQRKSHSREVPSSSQTGNIDFNDTAIGPKPSKKLKKRRLFQDSIASESKKAKFGWNVYESAGRDLLLWSENGEARRSQSVTSLDVIFNDVIDLEDRLKDSETEHLHQRLVGKVLGRMKRTLKAKIHQVEQVRDLESDVRKEREKCAKVRAEIARLKDKDKKLQRQALEREELKHKALQEWMKNLKSLIRSSRGQKE